MGFSCASYEEFSSGRCSEGKNACLFTTSPKVLDNNSNITDGNNYLQCLRMGFHADVSFQQVHKFINRDSNAIGVRPHKSQTTPTSTAMYFLQTSDNNPYCQFHYHIKIYCKSRKDLLVNNVEKGRLFIQIFGTKTSTPYLEASKE